jgi:glutamyl-tRNA synthetase
LATPFLEKATLIASPPTAAERETIEKVIVAAGDRIKVAGDVLAFPEFFQKDQQLIYDEPAFEKYLRQGDGPALLARFRDRLAVAEPFDATTLESLMQQFIADQQIKIGQVIHPVRVAVTGKSVGLGLFDTLAILGKETCLRRIERAIGR